MMELIVGCHEVAARQSNIRQQSVERATSCWDRHQ